MPHPSLPLPAADPAEPFVLIAQDDPAVRGAKVNTLLAECGTDVRVIRIANPLRAPLTVERILIQAGEAEAGLLSDAEADQGLASACQPRRAGERVLLLIEQAETLDAAALHALDRLARTQGVVPAAPAALPQLRIALAGRPRLLAQVASLGPEPLDRAVPPVLPSSPAVPASVIEDGATLHGMGLMRDVGRVPAVAERLPAVPGNLPGPATLPIFSAPPSPTPLPRLRRRKRWALVAVLLMIGLMGLAVLAIWTIWPQWLPQSWLQSLSPWLPGWMRASAPLANLRVPVRLG